MTTNFPTSKDTSATLKNDFANDTAVVTVHPTSHNNLADAVIALETKVGADSSAVNTSHDYKLGEVTSSDKAVGKSATQTLTNKTITSLVNAGAITIPTGTDTLVARNTTDTLTNKTLTTPTIGSFANATHSHQDAPGGGTLAEAALALTDITTNDVSTSKHGFTPKAPNDTGKFLRGDATWATPTVGSTQLTPSFTAATAISLDDAVFVLPDNSPITSAVASGTRTNTQTTLVALWDGTWLFSGGFFNAGASAGAGTIQLYNSGGNVLCDSNAAISAGVAASLINTTASTGTSQLMGMMQPNGTIARGATATAFSGTTTSLTQAITQAGSNLGLWVSFINNDSADSVTSVTWNGTAMTKIASQISAAGASYRDYIYFLANATSGTHNLVINSSSSVAKQGAAQFYTGVGAAVAIGDNAGKIAKASAGSATSSDSFIGFASAAISSMASGSVITDGLVTGLSGLSIGVKYYLSDTAGAISSTVGTVTRKVGISTSATTLLVTNNW